MSTTLLGGPLVEPVSLAEVKQRLRITHNDEDAVITALIESARAHVEVSTGLILMKQSWRINVNDWPEKGVIPLSFWPLLSVDKVTLYDDSGGSRILLPSLYQLKRQLRPATLCLQRSPLASIGLIKGLEIDVTAGYSDKAEDVPAPLRQAILLIIDYWFEVRGIAGNSAELGIPLSALEVMQPYYARRL